MDAPEPSLAEILNAAGRSRSRRRRWPLPLVVVLAAAATWFLWPSLDGATGGLTGRFITEPATQGPLTVIVSASGNLQPTKSVDVGSELSGTLEAVLVQENDRVTRGQVLARLDVAKLTDQVTKSRAAVEVAEATVLQMEATLEETTANLKRLQTGERISRGQLSTESELDGAVAARRRAEAALAGARASVTQARATLKSDETNLAKAVIRSPVDGVVLTRKVEPGQTVVANMSTPVLFVLAEDLTQMELQIQVDEADVGGVQIGLPASFTVSAWPNRRFPARLQRVGLGSTVTDNVVTYKTILAVKNDDLALRPGMTATAEIVIAEREAALLVPNAALRFTPPEPRGVAEVSFVSRLLPRPPQGPRRQLHANGNGAPRVWVLEAGTPRMVRVKPGLSNGRLTEILEGELRPGMELITDYEEATR